MILQLRHTTFIALSLKEIHSGRETGLIDTGPFALSAGCQYKHCQYLRILFTY